ncbi:Guanosine-diphosphatase, partial [Coemansia thaxteri]
MPSFSANDPDKNNDTSSSSNTRQSQAARLTNAQFIQRRGTQSASQNLDSSSHSSTPTLVSLGNQSSRQHTPYSGSSTPQGLSRVAYASESLTKAAAKKSDSIELSRLDTATDRLEGVVYEPTGASNMFGVDSYTSLGQYPGKSRKYALKSWLRLAAAVTVVCGLGYFAVSAFRSSSLGLGRSSDATVVDPRLQSMHCDIPHPGRPLVQYVLMVDAGSTGSRIHVYKFNYCKEHPELEDEIFEQVKPGLSSFENDAGAAAHSLDSLMEAAMKG